MNKYLFLFTITPVQNFISQARKTRDLFSGSKLLTELINESINLLPQNSKVIFPSVQFNSKLDSKPNRFVAELEVNDVKEVEKLGDKLESNVKRKLSEIGNKVFSENVGGGKPRNFDEQLSELLFPYWAAVELDEDNYDKSYKELEATLGAAKNIRAFNQTHEEAARKCSVCGERNALFYGETKHKPAYYQTDAKFGIKDLLPNEGLCAVCFTKRFYNSSSGKSFPSTAGIATMNLTSKISTDSEYKDYKQLFGKDFDEQLLYKENLTKKYFEKQRLDSNKLEKAKTLLFNVEREIKKQYSISFSKYYALIMFDGDSMGEWLSGKNLKEGISLKEFHSRLTESIGAFALKANEILVEPKGRVVYAGGEDFLGFVNLEYLFEIVRDLRTEYDKIINQPLKRFIKEGKDLTFSAGIVIAHYKMPLSSVLSWARQLEKSAKEYYYLVKDENNSNTRLNKNAFSLAVLKHSGEIHKTVFNWGNNENITQNWDFIEFTQNQLLNENFSRTFIKNFSIEFNEVIQNPNVDIKSEKLEMIRIEFNRLLKRSLNTSKFSSKNERSKILEMFSDTVSPLFEAFNTPDDVLNFQYALEIADFISRKVKGGE